MSGPGSDASGQSRTIPVVMMAAITVALASGASAYLLGMEDGFGATAPTVGQADAVLESGADGDRTVEIRHVAGEEVKVTDLEVVVDATDACDRRARLVDLPTDSFGAENVEGDDIFTDGSPGAGALRASADGTWSAGAVIQFRLNAARCALDDGDTVTVRVVHVPSDAVLVGGELLA